MRDLLMLGLLVLGCLWTLRQPWIGALMWTNVSLMSPHVQFGYASAFWPFGTAVALMTLIGLLIAKDRQNPLAGPAMWAVLAFVAWITITLPFSFYFDASYPLWVRSIKIFLMLFVTAALIDDRRKLDAFIWVNVISIGYYGVKGGFFTLVTGGNHRVWGPGGFIEGNNEVALAVIATIPLMRYLQQSMVKTWARRVMGVAMALSVVMALGTYSRGALLGLVAMAFLLWMKSSGKAGWAIVITFMAIVTLSLMPDQWWDRMGTMQNYEQDSSALGRINAWWNAFNLAKDRIFGGGFMIYFPEVFARYSPEPERVHAAHSIYFQVMGEHGFIGLFLFLLVGALTWRTCNHLIRSARRHDDHRWAGNLGAMVQVSMFGFAAGGAFLSLAYFDLPYNITLMVVLAWKFVQLEDARSPLRGSQATAAAAGAATAGAAAGPVDPPAPAPVPQDARQPPGRLAR